MLLPGCQSCSWDWSLSLWVVHSSLLRVFVGTTLLLEDNLPPLIRSPMWWHTLTPTICWNTSSSTQHSGASRQTTQSNQRGGTGWLFPGWRKGQGHKGNTSQRCLKTPATVTWDLEREGGERVEKEGGDWESEWEREGGRHVSEQLCCHL